APDARTVAASARDTVTVWELATGKPVRRFPLPATSPSSRGLAFTPDGRRLVTGHGDGTALVWDLTGTGRTSRATATLPAGELARAWEAQSRWDGDAAATAAWELADRPAQAVALFREKLKPAAAADEATVRRLVARLDAPGFADREAAGKELAGLEDAAV